MGMMPMMGMGGPNNNNNRMPMGMNNMGMNMGMNNMGGMRNPMMPPPRPNVIGQPMNGQRPNMQGEHGLLDSLFTWHLVRCAGTISHV